MNWKYFPAERPEANIPKMLPPQALRQVCLGTLGGKTKLESIREFSSGLFNNTYRVSMAGRPDLVLRIAPAPGTAIFKHEEFLLRRELSVEPALSAAVGIVPKTVASDFSHELIDRDFVFQTFLEGELWDEVKDSLTPAQAASLWRQLGAVAARIHRTHGKGFGLPKPKKSCSSWHEAFLKIAGGMREDLKRFKLNDSGTAEFLDLVRQGERFFEAVENPSLCHGDLWPKNVLIERRGDEAGIVGLLDAERAFWGDPHAEWIFHYYEVPDEFWEGYGPKPHHADVKFRASAYVGLYSMQIFLEGWREGFNVLPMRKRMAEAMTRMRGML